MGDEIFKIADFIGIISFAVSGFLAGSRRHLDIFGVSLLAFLTALGGGIARDVIVDKIPYSMQDFSLCLIVLATISVSLLLKLHKRAEIEQKLIFVVSDAIGLSAFSVSGALVALNAGLNAFGVCVLALLTAVGGGMIRDILVNEVPAILKSEFYATVAILSGLCVSALDFFGYLNGYSVSVLFFAAFLLRMTAYFREWHLPKLDGSI